MQKTTSRIQNVIYSVFALLALIIMFDFLCFGQIIVDDIVYTENNRELYYNAAGNSHKTYHVQTSLHKFYVSEDFAKSINTHEKIEYAISPIFREVNWYKQTTNTSRSYYSLRIVSGLVLPVIVLISMGIAFKTERDITMLVFVLQVLFLGNLVFLIL